MFIKDVSFLKSVSINSKEIFFDEKPEIVFVGRSNVWKSSLMNTIFDKKDLVKTSAKPWKTRLANIFVADKKYYFTDLPWYWFAKLWKELKWELDALISWYLEERRRNIKLVVILIDSRLWAQEKDIDMYKYLLDLWLNVVIVISKIDKLSNNELFKCTTSVSKDFFWQQIIPVSSLNNLWIDELEKALKKALKR